MNVLIVNKIVFYSGINFVFYLGINCFITCLINIFIVVFYCFQLFKMVYLHRNRSSMYFN